MREDSFDSDSFDSISDGTKSPTGSEEGVYAVYNVKNRFKSNCETWEWLTIFEALNRQSKRAATNLQN